MTDALQNQLNSKRGFIRAFGMFWFADEVDWTNGELLGRVNKNRGSLQVANFWDQRGIYVLYNDHGPYYVGKTMKQALGARLRQHHDGTSGHDGRWSRFSWFGWRAVLKTTDARGMRKLRKVPQGLLADTGDTIGDIESLLIHAMGTRWVGNLRSESFAAAVQWEQIQQWERNDYLDKIP